jgi:hypothetical protein
MKHLTACLLALSVLSFSGGCAWVTFTAQDDLKPRLHFKEKEPIKTVYVQLIPCQVVNEERFYDFKEILEDSLSARGLEAADSPETADLYIKAYSYSYLKQKGILYFWFGMIPHEDLVDGIEQLYGMKVKVEYRMGSRSSLFGRRRYGKWYKAYDDDYDTENAQDKIVKQIIDDLKTAPIPQGKTDGTTGSGLEAEDLYKQPGS